MFQLNKYIIILSLTVCGGWNCFLKAQTVVIPDANFATWLQTNVPSAMSGNLLDTTNVIVTTNTHTINCQSQNIANLYGVQFFKSLTCLHCEHNLLTSLPIPPVTLQLLFADYNSLTSLPILPPNLQQLFVTYNNLVTLPILPNSIQYIYCNVNPISSLPILPNSLKILYCQFNNLTTIPTLPASIKGLSCNDNHITTLPALPNTMVFLECGANSLTILPSLPDSLKTLFCSSNQLTSLPVLPTILKDLACSSNQLTTLPSLPQSLKSLYCSFNQLNSLPALPDSLFSLTCDNNNISCFPTFPNTIKTIPPNSFNISNNPYTCLPNYINAMDAATLAAPLCVDGNCPPVIDVTSDILIPNIFTPNNDSINDVWRFSLGKGSHLKNLSVFNRWGNLIDINTRTSVSEINWDGRTTSGEPTSVGVYFYVLQYSDAKGNEYKKNGYITLIR